MVGFGPPRLCAGPPALAGRLWSRDDPAIPYTPSAPRSLLIPLPQLLRDVEGLARARERDLFARALLRLRARGRARRGLQQVLVDLVGEPARSADADQRGADEGGEREADVFIADVGLAAPLACRR